MISIESSWSTKQITERNEDRAQEESNETKFKKKRNETKKKTQKCDKYILLFVVVLIRFGHYCFA